MKLKVTRKTMTKFWRTHFPVWFLLVLFGMGVTVFSQVRVAGFSFRISGGGVFVRSTDASESKVTVGHAMVVASLGSRVPPGLAIFGFRQQGVLVSEASVPASFAMTRGRVFAEVNSAAKTGIVILNPQIQPQIQPNEAIVSFYFTDMSGNTFHTGAVTIPTNQQIAAFLNEPPFNGGNSLLGTFTFTSSLPISAIALRGFVNERSEFLMTTLPVIPLDAPGGGNLVIPHFAGGGGWSTRVVFINKNDTVANGTVEFLDRSGQVIRTADYTVQPRASAELQTADTGTEIQTGSIRIMPGVPAFTIFSFKPRGVTVTEAGVAASSSSTAFKTYVENSGPIRSGIAIANSSPSAANVTLEVSGLSATIVIPANGQRAFFLSELPELASLVMPLQGVLRITSITPIAVTSLRGHINERGDFLITTTTPQDDTVSIPGSTLIFPHFVAGGGYKTEFVLFGQSSSGEMYFWDQTGTLALVFD